MTNHTIDILQSIQKQTRELGIHGNPNSDQTFEMKQQLLQETDQIFIMQTERTEARKELGVHQINTASPNNSPFDEDEDVTFF